MAVRQWIGGAEAFAQVTTWTLTGTWEANDIVDVFFGTHKLRVTAGSTNTTTIAATIVAALNLSDLPEIAEVTWTSATNVITGTADTEGKPYTATFFVFESDGTTPDADALINGAASHAGTDTTACTGPKFASNIQNWSGGALPVNGDTVVFADSEVDCLYGLTALAAVTTVVLQVFQSFTGRVGLAVYDEDGEYFQYRSRYLQFTGATKVEIGKGDGAGSQRLMFDFQATAAADMNVYNSGSPEDGEEAAVFLKGTHATNVLNVNKGRVGVAVYPGETSTLLTTRVGYQTNVDGDALLVMGDGMTISTINQSGGTLRFEDNVSTLNQTAGESSIDGAATVGALNLDGGTVRYRSSGTCTTLNLGSDGVMDFRQDMRGRTFTNVNIYEGFEWHDPFGTVTATNGYDFVRCTQDDGVFETVPNRTWTPTAI